jgi:hypothetical protein
VLERACPWRRQIDADLCHAAAVAQETAECYSRRQQSVISGDSKVLYLSLFIAY